MGGRMNFLIEKLFCFFLKLIIHVAVFTWAGLAEGRLHCYITDILWSCVCICSIYRKICLILKTVKFTTKRRWSPWPLLGSRLLKLSKVAKFSNVLQFVSRYEAVLVITGLFILHYRFAVVFSQSVLWVLAICMADKRNITTSLT